ncbi:hypothetical protein GBL_1436 [Geobacillus kaustophilus GBlys]|uniref:Uncharacterized protein n=1 Tax=Geobacillus kaustophilus GBlys TaxID=1337888 RepID=U2Y297_GEOKU|nr:hypothetical protein GBL_1436 [Geobacillus kaustophilus GBlys]
MSSHLHLSPFSFKFMIIVSTKDGVFSASFSVFHFIIALPHLH